MDKNTRFILVAGGMVFILAFLLKQQIRAGIQAAASVNEGTVFEDTGVIGTLGNIADTASGGVLSRFGSFIGNTLADIREGFGGGERETVPEDLRDQLGNIVG